MKFKELQALWYARLRAEGFVDIERPHGLADRHAMERIRTLAPVQREAAEEYYRLASAYAGPWASLLERRVWNLHTEGYSVRQIAAALRVTKDVAQRIVIRHRRRAGLTQ